MTVRRLWTDQGGATAAEFALMVPLMVLFLFGIMDVGQFAWRINQSEKATQMGARLAVVTDPVASGLTTESYVGKVVGGTTLSQGDTIPAAALGLITCTSASCTCTTTPCPGTLGYDTAGFSRIVARMAAMDPRIKAGDVRVEYRGSGLGYAGDPSGMEIAPLTTVKVAGMKYTPFTFLLFNTKIDLPSFAYSLTMEDGSGSVSN